MKHLPQCDHSRFRVIILLELNGHIGGNIVYGEAIKVGKGSTGGVVTVKFHGLAHLSLIGYLKAAASGNTLEGLGSTLGK